jgi:NRAMP (natural resistance-associated macrophage protein)-like metal ion transporter
MTDTLHAKPDTPPDKPRGLLSRLGPGLITGASDDDPSGIGTYSQAGAQLGYGIGWTMLLTFPLMAAIQEISARIGRVTGHGIAGNLALHGSRPLLYLMVLLLAVANTINIAADLAAMADATKLLVGGPAIAYVVIFGLGSVLAEIFLSYERYVMVLKWITLSLFAYVAVLFVIHVPWAKALAGIFIPQVTWSVAFFTTLVAIFGTTISPYLFFWQASEEAEEQRIDPNKQPLKRTPAEAPAEFRRIRADTMLGMAFSNIIALAIMIATAATLHDKGITQIETSAQAAEALKPIAGAFAEAIFALGIVGTGLLAVPVLAGATAYAVGESRDWPVGLARKPKHAIAFNSVLALSVIVAVAMNFTPINPISALYWSAVINGVIAVPIMVVMMTMAAKPSVMGRFVVAGPLRFLGWLSTAAMTACVAAMAVMMLI